MHVFAFHDSACRFRRFTVYTGEGDMSRYMTIDVFNGQKELKHWQKDSHCNQLKGGIHL